MRIVYKQALFSIYGVNEITVPEDSSFLCVHEQGGLVTTWFLCDPSKSVVKRNLYIVGTGQLVPDNTTYLGTAFVGEYVWHVFEEQS